MNVINNLIVIFLVLMVALPSHSDSLSILKLEELIPASRKPAGMNEGGVYVLKSDPKKKVYVKAFMPNNQEKNALILSYLTSRLLSLIAPGQGPTILPVLGGTTPLIASFDIPTFKDAGRNKGEHFALLNFALDLMDIIDRHGQNLGTAIINGKRDAVIVDVDMSADFKSSWFEATFDRSLKKMQVQSALAVISSFSDESIKNSFYAGVNELEGEIFFFWPSLAFFWPNLSLYFPVDLVFRNVILRKHQMEWTLRHFDSVFGIMRGNLKAAGIKETDIRDDKYGFFLKTAANDNNTKMFNTLLAYGSKDSEGLALAPAADNNNLEMVNALLARGAKDSEGRALSAAASKNNIQMVNALLEHGAKDPNGWALGNAVSNNNLLMFSTLLAYGAKDPNGSVLEDAARKNSLEMVNGLLKHGSKDPNGWALRNAVFNNNLAVFNALLAHGAKDPNGSALAEAVAKNNLEMFNALLAQGAKDSYGNALEVARRNKRPEMIKALEESKNK